MAVAVTDANLPIGVFDSGVGGLTVLSALRRHLPGEDFIYLGDTARLPYGSKSAATVERYAQQAAGALVAGALESWWWRVIPRPRPRFVPWLKSLLRCLYSAW